MSNIEVIICLLLLFMAVPDVCRKLGRPALVFPAFVLFGLLLAPVVNLQVSNMLQQAGEVGFVLLLFEVGSEIELPPFRRFLRPLSRAAAWTLMQYPLALAVAMLAGLDLLEACVGAAALTACSVGMAHPAWKSYPGFEPVPKQRLLQMMVALELIGIVLLSVESAALKSGWHWIILLKFAGMIVTVALIASFSGHLADLFQTILERTTHWRVHLVVLLVLAVCALGQRLGLDATKCAFFLGLAMSRARHDGLSLETTIAPVSHRFLIPVFFVALGLQIDLKLLIGWTSLLALGAAGLLLGIRETLQRRWIKTGGDHRSFLLLCPNLTIVALAAKAMLDRGTDPTIAAWLVLTGLFMTVPSLFLLPPGETSEYDGDTGSPQSLQNNVTTKPVEP